MSGNSDGSTLDAPDHFVLRVVVPFDTPAEYYRTVRPGEELKVGRGSRNHIVIANPCVSREHVVIRWDASGLTLSDLRTRNGTKVNKLRVVRDVSLQIGDCIEISSARIHVLPPDEVPESDELSEQGSSDSTTTVSLQRSSFIEANSRVQLRLGELASEQQRSNRNQPRILSRSVWQKVAMIVGGCALGLGIFWIILQRSL